MHTTRTNHLANLAIIGGPCCAEYLTEHAVVRYFPKGLRKNLYKEATFYKQHDRCKDMIFASQ